MFIICFAYLFFSRIRSRNWSSIFHFKILLLSLIPVLPWLKIGPGYYEPSLHNLISLDGFTTYSQMIQSQLSLVIFSLFIVAVLFVLFTNRDDLSLFFAFFFRYILCLFYFKGDGSSSILFGSLSCNSYFFGPVYIQHYSKSKMETQFQACLSGYWHLFNYHLSHSPLQFKPCYIQL